MIQLHAKRQSSWLAVLSIRYQQYLDLIKQQLYLGAISSESTFKQFLCSKISGPISDPPIDVYDILKVDKEDLVDITVKASLDKVNEILRVSNDSASKINEKVRSLVTAPMESHEVEEGEEVLSSTSLVMLHWAYLNVVGVDCLCPRTIYNDYMRSLERTTGGSSSGVRILFTEFLYRINTFNQNNDIGKKGSGL